jgi:hypothetical protein
MDRPASVRFEKLLPVLLKDAKDALQRASDDPSQAQRRAAVRAVFTMIEGDTFLLKDQILARSFPNLMHFSPGELAMLREEQYALDRKGNVVSQPKYSPTDTNFLFTMQMYMRGIAPLDLDTSSSGWSAFQESLQLRNLVTHPKNPEDFNITDQQYLRLKEACDWVVKTVNRNIAIAVLALLDEKQALLAPRPKDKSSPESSSTLES